jgi:zinc finger protein
MRKFSEELEDVISGRKLGIYIILDDPAGNSYLQNIYAPEPDPEMEVVHYERTFDQNEELGLNDIKVENYS